MPDIKQKLIHYLRTLKTSTVHSYQLEQVLAGEPISYAEFGAVVLGLENEGLLNEVRSAGRNPKPPHVAYRYRIRMSHIRSHFQNQLHQKTLKLHPRISLDCYYLLGESIYQSDLPYIDKINDYLQQHGLPKEAANASERSFELVGDEKWIIDQNGKSVLERIGLYSLLKIEHSMDPLMLAIHPSLFVGTASARCCNHLIVENKTTFHALLPIIRETSFSTLIYGCGNKIVGNMDMFHQQCPIEAIEHNFYYFGDIDHAGIQIWNQLNRKISIVPALPFYKACLEKTAVPGKINQRKVEAAIVEFSAYFEEVDRDRIHDCLNSGYYYPQEILSTQQLQMIWKESRWELWKPLI